MPTFSVSLWAVFEADNWEDAHRKATRIETALMLNDEVYVSDAGLIDVECTDEEYMEEESSEEDDSIYENIDKG
jgi:hypothetical protein